MKELTPNQVMAALNLAKNPLIASASVEVNDNGLSRISIKSAIGADFSEVDKLISTLGEHFPGLEYFLKPARYLNCDVEQELYFMNWEGETLIWLIMRLGMVGRKWTPEEIIREG